MMVVKNKRSRVARLMYLSKRLIPLWTFLTAALTPSVSALAATPSSYHHHHHQRSFQYVGYSQGAPPTDTEIPTIACDGRVPGATLEVSHWNGNDTPEGIYADTSTEMAINLVQNTALSNQYQKALVVNNHYDTDGVCSVFALVGNPNLVLQHRDVLIEAAESGDFEEWNSDVGLKLELILCSLCGDEEGKSYETALQELWKNDFDRICQDYNSIVQSGNVRLIQSRAVPEMVLLHEATATSRVSPDALSRALKEQGMWEGTNRILRINHQHQKAAAGDDSLLYNKYSYEKIGHGWVNKLVIRPMVSPVDAEALVERLNGEQQFTLWNKGGPGGLIAICQTNDPIDGHPEDIARQLAVLDEGCSVSDRNEKDDDAQDDTQTSSKVGGMNVSVLRQFANTARKIGWGKTPIQRSSSFVPFAIATWNQFSGGGAIQLPKRIPPRFVRQHSSSVALALAISGGASSPAAAVSSGLWVLPALVCATAYAFYNLFIKKASSSTSAPIDPILGGVLLQLVAAMMGATLYLWKRLTVKGGGAALPNFFSKSILKNGGVGWSVAAGLAVGAAEILSFMISGMGVPASKSIPTVVGGSVVVGTIAGSIWLKEKLSVGGWIGVLLIALGIALVGMDPSSAGGH